MSNFTINGGLIDLSEIKEGDSSRKEAKFLLCPLNEANGNGVGLKEEDLTDDEIQSLVGQPLVTKLIYDSKTKTYDFSGHLRKQVYKIDKDGNVVSFSDFTSTSPIGYHTGVGIEDIDIDGVIKRCLVATVTLWTRYYHAMDVIDRLGTQLKTSWELSYADTYEEDGVQWRKGITFLANCVLGTNVTPAYKSAGLLEEVAEELNNELEIAMLDDLKEIKNDSQSDNSVEDISNLKGGVEDMEKDNKVEQSALSTNDIRNKVANAIYSTQKDGRYYWGVIVRPYDFVAYASLDTSDSNEDDYTKFTYVVNSDDTVSITGQEDVKMVFIPKADSEEISEMETKLNEVNISLAEKVDEIVKLGETIKSLETSIAEKDGIIAELEPIKVQMEEAEKKAKEEEDNKKKAELSEMLVGSKYFTQEEVEQSEELQEAINKMDESTLKIKLAERVVEQASKITNEKPEVKDEVSEKKENIEVSTNLNSEEFDYATEKENALLGILNKKSRRKSRR